MSRCYTNSNWLQAMTLCCPLGPGYPAQGGCSLGPLCKSNEWTLWVAGSCGANGHGKNGKGRRKRKARPRSGKLLYFHKAQRERINKALLSLLLLPFFFSFFLNSFSQCFFSSGFFHLSATSSLFSKKLPWWDTLRLKNDKKKHIVLILTSGSLWRDMSLLSCWPQGTVPRHVAKALFISICVPFSTTRVWLQSEEEGYHIFLWEAFEKADVLLREHDHIAEFCPARSIQMKAYKDKLRPVLFQIWFLWTISSWIFTLSTTFSTTKGITLY